MVGLGQVKVVRQARTVQERVRKRAEAQELAAIKAALHAEKVPQPFTPQRNPLPALVLAGGFWQFSAHALATGRWLSKSDEYSYTCQKGLHATHCNSQLMTLLPGPRVSCWLQASPHISTLNSASGVDLLPRQC